jgi:hypothetical protein
VSPAPPAAPRHLTIAIDADAETRKLAERHATTFVPRVSSASTAPARRRPGSGTVPSPCPAASRADTRRSISSLVGRDASVCSASTSRHIASQRSSTPPSGSAARWLRPSATPAGPESCSAATHRCSVRMLTPSSAAFAWYRSSSGSDGSNPGRGSPGSAAAGVPEAYPVSASRR